MSLFEGRQRVVLTCMLTALLVLSAGIAFSQTDYVTKPKLTARDVQPYVEKMLSESGDTFIKIHRVVNHPDKAIVFFRSHSRYGRTGNHQIVFIKQKASDRWMNRDRQDFLKVHAGSR